MTTERKPSERAVEQWPSVELHAKSLEALANGREGDQNIQETLRFAAKHIRHLGRSESEMAEALDLAERQIKRLAERAFTSTSDVNDFLSGCDAYRLARKLLTTYHQRKETQ